jgi:hypothetical protein
MVRASPPRGKIFGALIEEVGFAADSLLEEAGFELTVPRDATTAPSFRLTKLRPEGVAHYASALEQRTQRGP